MLFSTADLALSGRPGMSPIHLQDLDVTPFNRLPGGSRSGHTEDRDESKFSAFASGVFDVLACTVVLTQGSLLATAIEPAPDHSPRLQTQDAVLEKTAHDRGLLLELKYGSASNRENEARLTMLTERLRSLDSRVSPDAVDMLTETVDNLSETARRLAAISREFDL